jgi:PAS domain S-box-containing protein
MSDPVRAEGGPDAATLLRCSPDGIVCLSLEGAIVDANDAFARLTARARDALIGLPHDHLTPREYHDMETRLARAVVETGTPAGYEKEYLRESGERVPAWVSLFAVAGARGPAVGVGAIVRDLSDRRRTDQALRHIQRIESLRVLARGVSHDFNNVLGAVVGHLTLAQQPLPADHPAREHLARAQAAVKRATKLVDQLLLYSGSGEHRAAPTDLNALLEEQRAVLETTVGSARLRLQPGPVADPVPVDRAQLQQLLVNVLTNAAESLHVDGGTVTVRTTVREVRPEECARWSRTGAVLPSGRYAALEVEDDGSGMSREVQARAFDPFYTTKFIGRGLGLATALGIARAHHGGIDVDSVPGRGTIVTVLLPFAAPRNIEARRVAPLSGARGVLVVEDEDEIRSFAEHVLRAHGFDVVSAADGLSALERLKQRRDDIGLVLLDLSMPRMTGDEVFRRMREAGPLPRVILTSGYPSSEATAAFVPGELSGFLHKPYDAETLIARVRETLG